MDAVWCYNFDLRERVYKECKSITGDDHPCIDFDFLDFGEIEGVATAHVRYTLQEDGIRELIVVSEKPVNGRFPYAIPRSTYTERVVTPSDKIIEGTREYIAKKGSSLVKIVSWRLSS